jgi:hypothetical protein
MGVNNGFLVFIENSGYPDPAYTNAYVYHPEQDDFYGEHWYPDGTVSNGAQNFGPTFVVRPKVLPPIGTWVSYEVMVQLNTPGIRDGRVAVWQDGALIADWQNVRFRDTSTLKIDKIDLSNGGKDSTQQNDKWYDNLVLADSYIGPMATGTTPVSTKFSLSDRVSVTDGPVTVRSTAGGTSLGTQAIGILGTVIGGPTSALLNSIVYWWWNINFDSGVDGWVAEEFISKDTTPVTHNITASAGSNGSISPSGSVSVNRGYDQPFTITPNNGYQASVLVDGVSQGTISSYTFSNVTANHTISATFQTIPTGNTITAASCNASDVQSAINQAQAGNTVVIPAGTCRWASAVSFSGPANVTLKGAGTSAIGGGDQTVIIDDISANSGLLTINLPSSGVVRLTGITFRSGTGSLKDGGTLKIFGPGKVRIDHIHSDFSSGNNYKWLNLGVGAFGVLDNSLITLKNQNAIYAFNGRQTGGDFMGNTEWSLPTNFGSDEYFYIENNIFDGSGATIFLGDGTQAYSGRVFDGFTAAKIVVRFNNVIATVLAETHATGHSPDDRGLRSQEIYGNSVTSPLAAAPNFVGVDMGSGTSLVWGNSMDQVYKNIFIIKTTRANNSVYGQNSTPSGWGYCGTQFNGASSMWDGGTALGTDTTLGYPCLDQPGRGQGDLLVGAFPNKTNQVTGNIFWPHQQLEPIYIWNNVGNIVPGHSGNYTSNSSFGRVVANRDYYPSVSGTQTSQSSPFNGTSGTGWGTLANRPTSCTAGVGYFATDQGSWNTSTSNPYGVQQNGADGVLYKCTGTNTWTQYYTPYTYPHPLRAGI